ncbi:hypothetical protein [Nocardia veterana]|uniref:hypothetical protein n=1 Tax=Nocardia veterana TaxID=132249 RepID=UPI0002D95726|nr:hypothetical protein [Nocardia veterana]
MSAAVPARASAAVWRLAVPSNVAVAGVRMAGFSGRATQSVDMRVVPYPAVTVFVEFGDGTLIDETAGRELRHGGIVGPLPGGLRACGREVDCLQIRLSPPLARRVFGDVSELTATVTAFDEVWGRDAEALRERLHAARDWEARFAIAADALVRRRDAGPLVDAEVAFA